MYFLTEDFKESRSLQLTVRWEFDYQSLNISYKNLMTCTLIVRLHKYIICFDLDMYFLIDSNMSTIVMTINKCMHLVMFYYFAVINYKYHNLLKSYIYLKLTAF